MAQSRITFPAAGLTDVGRVRKQNEDAFVVLPEEGLFVVSDGMGGRQGGEVASSMVVDLIPRRLKGLLPDLNFGATMEAVVRDVLMGISREVHQRSVGKPSLQGMGATVVVAYIRNDQICLAWLGDSRAYRMRNRSLEVLTDDHSVVALLLRDKRITPQQARVHPARSMLSRFVGMENPAPPDVQSLAVAPGDRILLCSDGLYGMVEEDELAALLKRPAGLEESCRLLVDAANESGGRDNITVVLIDVPENPG